MTVELRPLGVKCNIQCQYCYQNPQRDAGNVGSGYDLERMKAAIEAEGGPFSLFGGEALLVREHDLEALWAWGYQKYGSNSLQTNGILINDEHIRLFKQYNVFVGISVDGPGALNDARWSGTLSRTRENTAKTHRAIERLCREGLPPSLIVTLHRTNATRQNLPILCEWLLGMEALGVTQVRLHELEIDHPAVQNHYALSADENLAALQAFADLERKLTTLHLDLFDDMRNLLLGRDNSITCVWKACDPYTTRAVRGVEGNGQRSNCGRTNKDGIDFVKTGVEGFERYIALYFTPHESGGCRDCRFFLQCKGQCPGTALEGDWRNRTEHCEIWKGLYGRLEEELLGHGQAPLSVSPLRPQLEALFLDAWAAGKNPSLTSMLEQLSQGAAAAPPAIGKNPPAAGVLSRDPVPAGESTGLERLNFSLPRFTRMAWVSDAARQIWAPRLTRLREVWSEIEWLTVAANVRRCAVLTLPSSGVAAGAVRWERQSLTAQPVGRPASAAIGQWVVGTARNVADFMSAWNAGDSRAVGDLLGQPACCLEFFRQTWMEQGSEDLTWRSALATKPVPAEAHVIELAGPPQANPLWRWLGVRAISHVPCRFDCSHTVALADQFIQIGYEAGYSQEMEWLLEVLSWPVEWSALHGIAEVRTPVLKLATRTDATARKYIVRRLGDRYPLEGAEGVHFPYRQARRSPLTSSSGYRRGLANTPAGNKVLTGMAEAHDPR